MLVGTSIWPTARGEDIGMFARCFQICECSVLGCVSASSMFMIVFQPVVKAF